MNRHQIGGPAHGLLQFERGGGVRGREVLVGVTLLYTAGNATLRAKEGSYVR